MQPENSLLCSRDPAIVPCPEPDEYSPQFPILFPQNSF
jgi:hypothetical protein